MIFISAKKDQGDDEPTISNVSKYRGIKRQGVDEVERVKGTRYEHDSNGIKVYQILAFRNGLDLNANMVVDTDDENEAKEAVLSLLDS